jgi:hypothetical protein
VAVPLTGRGSVVRAIDQPLGLAITELTLRASGEDHVN